MLRHERIAELIVTGLCVLLFFAMFIAPAIIIFIEQLAAILIAWHLP